MHICPAIYLMKTEKYNVLRGSKFIFVHLEFNSILSVTVGKKSRF